MEQSTPVHSNVDIDGLTEQISSSLSIKGNGRSTSPNHEHIISNIGDLRSPVLIRSVSNGVDETLKRQHVDFRTPSNHNHSLDNDDNFINKKKNLNPTPYYDRIFPTQSQNSTTDNNIDRILNNKTTRNFVHKVQDSVDFSGKLLVVSSISNDHDTGNHQENSQRTNLLCGTQGCLKREKLVNHMVFKDADILPDPPLSDLLRVHDYDYLQHLENKAQHAIISESDSSNDKVNNNNGLPDFYARAGFLDFDTPLVANSLNAAKKFCSAAMMAVDEVLSESSSSSGVKRALVIGRPPGHHAGPSGCVPGRFHGENPNMTSSGFCLLNTVAVAAAYARCIYGRQALRGSSNRAPRIAIVDIDIHHGNGTEEIVRNLKPHRQYLPLPSSWAPVSRESYKPWLNAQDADEVLFASVHRYEAGFYPNSGGEEQNSAASNIINITLTPLCVEGARKDTMAKKKREELHRSASKEFREKISTMLLPRLRSFQPDLLFISSGFDAHIDDMYHFLHETDFHWVTQQLCDIVEQSGNASPRGIISVLEGGYSLFTKVDGKETAASSGGKESGLNKDGSVDINRMFAQVKGDGGLVKGVLAHTAALLNKPNW